MEPCGTLDHHKVKFFVVDQKDGHKNHNLNLENLIQTTKYHS